MISDNDEGSEGEGQRERELVSVEVDGCMVESLITKHGGPYNLLALPKRSQTRHLANCR